MKALERQEFGGGMGGSHFRVRVTECETLPEGAVRVADDAALVPEWTPEVHVTLPAPYVEAPPQ